MMGVTDFNKVTVPESVQVTTSEPTLDEMLDSVPQSAIDKLEEDERKAEYHGYLDPTTKINRILILLEKGGWCKPDPNDKGMYYIIGIAEKNGTYVAEICKELPDVNPHVIYNNLSKFWVKMNSGRIFLTEKGMSRLAAIRARGWL